MAPSDNSVLRCVSYNSRGFNESRRHYICNVLYACDMLFLQEHWLSDDQLVLLNSLSSEHVAVGISGFGDADILNGRPYGGCAIVWRTSLCLQAMPIDSGSRRVCAVLFSGQNLKLLCISVYMPFEHNDNSWEEFQYQLAVIDALSEQHPDCQVVLGGDFNVDLMRNWSHTALLNDFCMQGNLTPVIRHVNSAVDYTYHFNMRHLSCIDHFIVSDVLFQSAVLQQHVLHDVDNTSDHDPLFMMLDISVARLNVGKRAFTSRPSWNKATEAHIAAYKSLLRCKLSAVSVPREALSCNDLHCRNSTHTDSINNYVSVLAETLQESASVTIPCTRRRGEGGCIPGWTEQVAPLREKSVFWHQLWVNCDRPRAGLVADIMRKTRLQYHAAIRAVRRNENDIVNARFASSVTKNRSRDFWQEVKRIRRKCNNVSNVVDGVSNADDIAELFAEKYSTLYNSVSYDVNDMSDIRSELNESIECVTSDHAVTGIDVLCAIKQLKAGKSDGSLGLVSDHFINACDEFNIHVAMLFSALLVHGLAPDDLVSGTLIPIPKGKNVNITDSSNYRAIALSSIFGKVFDLIFCISFICACVLLSSSLVSNVVTPLICVLWY